MNRALIVLFCFFVAGSPSHAAPKETKSKTNPEAGGILIAPDSGEITPGDELTMTFPEAMVATNKIDISDQPPPFVSEPKIDGTFLWKSQTEGVFVVKN